jgi:chromosome partitioning protein
MNIITVINAKGGCGKSTIAMSLAAGLAVRGMSTLLIDMDPQAQVTQWLGLGDGLLSKGTLVEAMEGKVSLAAVVQVTRFNDLWFVASSQGLEDLGRQITDVEGYQTLLTRLLASLNATPEPAQGQRFEFVVIDSPNQISPVMENCIFPSDVFVVPFESTKAVRSYANFYQLLMRIRPGEQHRVMHVLSNLSRQPGLRQRVIDTLNVHGIARARTEVRTCGWLAQVDENGGSIFNYRPHSKGTEDMTALVQEVLELLGIENPKTILTPISEAMNTVADESNATGANIKPPNLEEELSINHIQQHD